MLSLVKVFRLANSDMIILTLSVSLPLFSTVKHSVKVADLLTSFAVCHYYFSIGTVFNGRNTDTLTIAFSHGSE